MDSGAAGIVTPTWSAQIRPGHGGNKQKMLLKTVID